MQKHLEARDCTGINTEISQVTIKNGRVETLSAAENLTKQVLTAIEQQGFSAIPNQEVSSEFFITDNEHQWVANLSIFTTNQNQTFVEFITTEGQAVPQGLIVACARVTPYLQPLEQAAQNYSSWLKSE